MQIDFLQATAEMMDWRDFSKLHPTDIIAEWETPNNKGYSRHWVTRIVTEDTPNWAVEDHSSDPIIEFYSIGNFGQFVSAYYVDTFLGNDGYGSGYGHGLDLYGGVASWKIDADHLDEIREWAETECLNAGFNF